MPGLFCSIQFNFIFLHIQFYIHRSTITCRCKRNCCIIKYCTRYFTCSIPAPLLMAAAFTSFTLPSSSTAIPGLLLPILSCTTIYLALACFTALFISSPKIRQVNIQAVLLSFIFCPWAGKPLLNCQKIACCYKNLLQLPESQILPMPRAEGCMLLCADRRLYY